MPDSNQTREILAALSAPRMSTYVRATGGDVDAAMSLYGWNARISAALMVPAHFAEITVRNAVDEALTLVYGLRWPWNPTFERSLPDGRAHGYSQRSDLVVTRARQPSTGKVIAELKFVFWEKMFTARHDVRLWVPHIAEAFPAAPSQAPTRLRGSIRLNLSAIRALRNRIAHHEPIFTRDLFADLAMMEILIGYRSPATCVWEQELQDATELLTERPRQ